MTIPSPTPDPMPPVPADARPRRRRARRRSPPARPLPRTPRRPRSDAAVADPAARDYGRRRPRPPPRRRSPCRSNRPRARSCSASPRSSTSTLSDEELETFAAAAPATLAGFTRLDELPDEHLPVKYPRADLGHRPTGAENPSNGWSWKCSIPGAAEGPLAGKRVGRQGQRLRRRHPDAQRLADHGGLRPARGRDRRHAPARRGRRDRRQDRGPGVLLRRRRR